MRRSSRPRCVRRPSFARNTSQSPFSWTEQVEEVGKVPVVDSSESCCLTQAEAAKEFEEWGPQIERLQVTHGIGSRPSLPLPFLLACRLTLTPRPAAVRTSTLSCSSDPPRSRARRT